MNRRSRRMAALAAVALAWLAPSADAGEWFPRTSALLARKPDQPKEADTGEIASTMNWLSVPRPARAAARKLAKSKDASVTRCVAIERDDRVIYEVHASHRLGLFKKDDFILTSVDETREAAEKRREEATLKRRAERLRDSGKKAMNRLMPPEPKGPAVSPGSTAFPPGRGQ